ncbi:MAG: histidine phosphatase family protein [Ilumatobacteraceae bacterium]
MTDAVPTPPPTRLLLVRHGESVATVTRRIGGYRTCRGLSDLGRRQAERLRDRWIEHPELEPTAVYSSAYPRARETAAIVLPAFGPGTELLTEAGFGEHDPGPTWDGRTYDEFTEAHGMLDWENPWAETLPGGETIAAFHFRVGTALHDVLLRHAGGAIVVFCHGGVVDATFRNLLRLPGTGGFQLHTLNTALTEFRQVSPRQWQLTRYNDSAHLAGLPTETART